MKLQPPKSIRAIIFLTLPTFLIGLLLIGTTYWHIPTNMEVKFSARSVKFTVGGSETRPLVDGVSFETLMVKQFSRMSFSMPASLDVIDKEQSPERVTPITTRSQGDFLTIDGRSDPMALSSVTFESPPSKTSSSAIGTLEALRVPAGATVTLTLRNDQNTNPSIQIKGPQTSVQVLLTEIFRLSAENCELPPELQPAIEQQVVTLQISLPKVNQRIEIAGQPETFQLDLTLAQDNQGNQNNMANMFSKAAISVTMLDFSPYPIKYIEIEYPDYPGIKKIITETELDPVTLTCYKLSDSSFQKLSSEGLPANVLNSLKSFKEKEFTKKTMLDAIEKQIGKELTNDYKEFILKYANNLEGFYLKDLTLNPQVNALEFQICGIAHNQAMGSFGTSRDYRLTIFDLIWHNRTIIILLVIIVWGSSTLTGGYLLYQGYVMPLKTQNVKLQTQYEELRSQNTVLEAHLSELQKKPDLIPAEPQISNLSSSSDNTAKANTLPPELYRKINKFLLDLPHIEEVKTIKELCAEAGLDHELQARLDLNGSAADMVHELLEITLKYGTLHDGRSPIEAILEAAKNHVGLDKGKECDQLIQELQNLSQK